MKIEKEGKFYKSEATADFHLRDEVRIVLCNTSLSYCPFRNGSESITNEIPYHTPHSNSSSRPRPTFLGPSSNLKFRIYVD